MADPKNLAARVASKTGLSRKQVSGTLALLDEGNTVPFIARYRKERTGNLDEVQIRDVASAADDIRQLESRRESILETIEEQGELTAGLRKKLEKAETLTRLEDLYAPYKRSRLTRGRKAVEAGLQPVADALLGDEDVYSVAAQHTCEKFPTRDDVIGGAKDIVAEEIAHDAEVRDYVRSKTRKQGVLASRKRRGAEEDENFELYLGFSTPLKKAKPHQVLAIRRGENEKALSAGVEVDERPLLDWISSRKNKASRNPNRKLVDEAIEDGYKRLIHPSVERDLRGELEDRAEQHAIEVFAVNLEQLLLQPPMPGKRVLGVDPGYRTGCKLAVVDENGRFVENDSIYVHDNRKKNAAPKVRAIAERHEIDLIAVGNGTGSRETEEIVAEAIRNSERDMKYLMVDEAGASVYSASDIARREFPDLDVSVRGAISIARRVQDPLAELVKIDPKSVGVGMYQHDVNQNRLSESVDNVVEDVVNAVGVDLNSASEPLLARVAGIGPTLARRIVAHRDKVGQIRSRAGLKNVRGVGARTFEQCAGFLRIRDGAEPLDQTGIHPESYKPARSILKAVSATLGQEDLSRRLERLRSSGKLTEIARQFGVGELTLEDVVDALVAPGRDPRDEVDAPVLRSDVLTMDDLRDGMRLTGTVRNVVDFGAFVDIGVKQDGLVHISEMANHYVKNPHEEVSVGDTVEVVVQSVDKSRGRIGLSIKAARA
ncbi:MAG: Tex family protein [Myxococcota bacterium]